MGDETRGYVVIEDPGKKGYDAFAVNSASDGGTKARKNRRTAFAVNSGLHLQR